jgi:hypothetical protein
LWDWVPAPKHCSCDLLEQGATGHIKPTTEQVKHLLDYTSRSRPCPARRNCRHLRCTKGHICQKQECEYNRGTQQCKLPMEAHGGDLRVHQLVKGVSDVEHTTTTGPGSSKSPIRGDQEPNFDGSDKGQTSEVAELQDHYVV